MVPEDDGPQEAAPPAPMAYSGGACPSFVMGNQTFVAGGETRDVTVTLPQDPAGAGVLFLWHGFGDTGPNFSLMVGAAGIGQSQHLITVSPAAVLDPFETEKLAPFKDMAQHRLLHLPNGPVSAPGSSRTG